MRTQNSAKLQKGGKRKKKKKKKGGIIKKGWKALKKVGKKKL